MNGVSDGNGIGIGNGNGMGDGVGDVRDHVTVLHVITGLGVGGAERQLLLLVRRLRADHDAEVEVAVLTNPGVVARALRAEGVPVHEIGMRGNRDLAALPRLIRLIREVRPDIVHTHLFRAGLYGRLAARAIRLTRILTRGGERDRPVIIATEHSIGETRIEARRMTWAVRLLYRAAERLGDQTIAVSWTAANRLAAWGVRPDRIVVIPDGIEAGTFRFDAAERDRVRTAYGIDGDRFVVGAVGRLEPGKRFDVLIEALAVRPSARGAHAPASDLERAVLLLVGDGAAAPALRELAEQRGVADRVIFAGEVPDVAGPLAAMDVLAAPSQEETFGLSVLEGLAAGLPVRYVTCPALDDLPAGSAPDARPVRLDPQAFHAELAQLARRTRLARRGGGSDLTRRRDLADRAGPVAPAVGHYDIADVANRTMTLYERLLAAGPNRRALTTRPAPSGGGTR